MHRFFRALPANFYRVLGSHRSTEVARLLILSLAGMILMIVLMNGLLDITRVVHPVARIAAFFGDREAEKHIPGAVVTRPAETR